MKTPTELAETISAHQRTGDITRLAKGAGVSISGRIVGRGVNFLGQVILARFLGPEAYGLFAIGWTILRIIGIIGPLGLEAGIIRFGVKFWQDDQQNFRRIFFISTIVALISGVVIGVCLFLASPFLAEQIFHKPGLTNILRGLSAAMPFLTTLRVVASATSISQSMKYSTYSEEIAQPTVELLIFIGLFYMFGWKLEGAVWAVVVSFGAALALAGYYMLHLFPTLMVKSTKPAKVEIKQQVINLLSASIPTAFAVLFGSFISWVDRLMVGYFRNSTETGIYTTISLISIIFVIILSGIKVIYSPMIADLYNKKEMKRIEDIYRISTKWGLYLSLPIFFVILFAAREILTLSFGSAYASGYNPLILLSLAQLINIGTGPLDILLIMTGRQKAWLEISAGMLLANILLNSILIPLLGITGAAIGTASTVTGIFIIGLIKIKGELNIWPYDRRFIKMIVASIFTVSALLGVSYLNIHPPIFKVAVVSIVTCTVFTLGLLIQGLGPEDWEIIKIVKKKVFHKPIESKPPLAH
jgi:O-antigen/teichoic acid export membrane protein